MDKKIAGLLGAVGAFASLNTAQAGTAPDTSEVLKAGSFADLLKPIPNAAEKLQAVDETQTDTKTAQLVIEGRHHHHHHHHHAYHRERRIVVMPRRHHHHHHHHHGIIIR